MIKIPYELDRDQLSDIKTRFTYHPPFGDQPARYVKLRDQAKDLAFLIVENTPKSREQSLALTHLESTIFFANAAIARHEVQEGDSVAPKVPIAPTQWPLPPHLRMPRLVAGVGQFVRSTGTDDKGNYYEDFYPPGSDQKVYRDDQGYFQIDDGAVYLSYLNPPGASIEHRLVPRPGSGASLENT